MTWQKILRCYRDNSLGEQVKVALIATDFADAKVFAKEDVSGSEYQKSLMDMYYGTPNRKTQAVMEEVTIDEPGNEEENEEVILDTVKREIQKPKFLDRFLKTLGDMVEKID